MRQSSIFPAFRNNINYSIYCFLSAFALGGAGAQSALAADFGAKPDNMGACCADLEERVADLEHITVTKGNRKVSLKISGFVNRALLIWDDTELSDVYSVGGPDDDSSRIRFKGKAVIGGGWSAGFLLEWAVYDTSVETVSQINDDGSDEAEGLRMRHETFFINHKRLGTIALGHTSTATDGVSEIDLSGTSMVASSNGADWVGAFSINAGGASWNQFIDNLDGVREDLVRYDSPNLAGFTFSASLGEDDYWDIAMRYANEFGNTIRMAAAIGYRQTRSESVIANGSDALDTLHGSLSLMHIPTGFNVAVAGGEQDDRITKANFLHVRAGFAKRVSMLGKTAIYGEYGIYNDFGQHAGFAIASSEATLWGLGLTQSFDRAATDVYLGYRQYSLDIEGGGFGEINGFSAVFAGAKISF